MRLAGEREPTAISIYLWYGLPCVCDLKAVLDEKHVADAANHDGIGRLTKLMGHRYFGSLTGYQNGDEAKYLHRLCIIRLHRGYNVIAVQLLGEVDQRGRPGAKVLF